MNMTVFYVFIGTYCSPIFIWGLIRHGTRHGRRNDVKHLGNIAGEIVTNYEFYNRSSLCPEDLANLKHWKYPWSEEEDTDLTSEGSRELASLAYRLSATFTSLSAAPRSAFVFQSTFKNRAKNSAIAFTNALLGTDYNDTSGNNITINNPFLRFLADSKEWKVKSKNNISEEEIKLSNSSLVRQLMVDVSNRLGFNETLSLDHIKEMYQMCALENAFHPELTHPRPSAFCVAFTPPQLELLEYMQDLHDYYSLGYGNTFNVEFPNPLVGDLMEKLNHAARDENQNLTGAFYFAHTETIIPTVLKLDMYHNVEPLRANDFETLKKNRIWRMSRLSPFAANIIVLLFKCTDDFNVVFYHNEYVVEYPGCSKGVCPLSVIQNKFMSTSEKRSIENGGNYLLILSGITVGIIIGVAISFLAYKKWAS